MSTFTDKLSPKEWEEFCAIMLRHHYNAKNFWVVPDEDRGDLGLEFFTVDGTLFQCYYPDMNIDMAGYKAKIKKKIREDLKKLKKNEAPIAALLDDIVVNQWVLVIPKLKSKDLIAYCNKKKKEVQNENLAYIDSEAFQVKIETPSSFPEGALYAKGMYSKAIDIPLAEITEKDIVAWQKGNSEFAANIVRKSDSLIGQKSNEFQDRVVTKYIQIEKFLDQLREDHPDLHELVENSARAQLENMKDESLLQDNLDKEFVKGIVDSNSNAFSKHSQYMSDTNRQSLSFGYLSKWLAECYMDFSDD